MTVSVNGYSCSSAARTSDKAYQVRRMVKHTLNANVNIVLLVANLDLSTCVFGFRERIEGLKVLDVCGHKTGRSALLVRVG